MTGAADLAGAAMADYAAGRAGPLYLGTPDGHRLPYDLSAYFVDPAALPEPERTLLASATGPVLDVGCGPARHARHLQQRGVHAVGLDRSGLALATARTLGLRHGLHADVRRDPLPAGIGTVLLLDGNLGLAGTVEGTRRLLDRLAGAAAAGARLLVAGRAPRGHLVRTVQLRVEYRGTAGPWFSWLLLGLPAVVSLAAPAGWRLVAAAVAGHDYWACLELAGEGRS